MDIHEGYAQTAKTKIVQIETAHIFYLGQMYTTSTCVLQHHVASTALALQLFTDFTARRMRLILSDRCTEIRSAPLAGAWLYFVHRTCTAMGTDSHGTSHVA